VAAAACVDYAVRAASVAVFVDSGAWIAVALTRDPLHARARETWTRLQASGARLHTSAPVALETFTFLDRNAAREAALAWKDSLAGVRHLRTHPCTTKELDLAWRYFERPDLHKLSATDAVSFVVMTQLKITRAFTFDAHFATAGFKIVG
jgi:predicted nucleic acid-binding protein